MKKSQFILAAAFFAVSGSLKAAGTIKTYLVEAAFASDESVDWIGEVSARANSATDPNDSLQVPRFFSGATSQTGSVAVSIRMATGNPPSANPSPANPSPAGRRQTTDPNSRRLTVAFTSGPVMGVGVRIQANGAGQFTHRLNAYDAAGGLLGTTTVAGTTSGTSSGMVDNASTFIGIRSSRKEIVKVEIDASCPDGFTISGLRLGLRPVIENDWFFVNQQFQDLYGRAPSPAELTGYLTALTQGTSTRAKIAASLFQSAEFHESAGFLVKCYLAVMQRDPDFVQWSQILKLMQGGATRDNALIAFMNTPEYAAAYPAGLSDGAFVTRLYRNLLGRDPESGEMDSWIAKLAKGSSRRDMVGVVLRSPEFEVRIATRVDASLAYLAFLRRSGEPAGMNRWIEALKTGSSVTDLVGAMIAMPEYAARF